MKFTTPIVAVLSCSLTAAIFSQDQSSELEQELDYEVRSFTTSFNAIRKYLIRYPSNYEPGQCTDVIFDFHGAGSSAEREFAYSGFADIADRENLIMVYPDANKEYRDQDHRLASYWNSAWEAVKRERDYDVDFIVELAAFLQQDHCVQNLYATGMSAGGDMTSALACLTDTPFRAFAAVTYRFYYPGECADASPRPFLSFQGDNDQVVPIDGSGAPWFDPPMTEIMRRWAVHNDCSPSPTEQRISDEVVRYYWTNCQAPTEWYLIEGGGHAWPGSPLNRPGRQPTQDISASELIWAFFDSNRK